MVKYQVNCVQLIIYATECPQPTIAKAVPMGALFMPMSLQGLSERMAKVKHFLRALNFEKSLFSQLSLVDN